MRARRTPGFGRLPLPAAVRRNLRGIRRAVSMGMGAAQTLSITQLITAAANANGVSPALALAVATRESGLNPNAYNAATGASGVMQLMPPTAASLGVTDLMDPTQNINAGVKYLAQLLSTYGGDVSKAVAAYDWGPGNLNADIAQNGDNWLAYAPAETQNYVASITGITPGSAAASSSASAPLTIDANTGEILPSVDVSQMPTVTDDGSILPASFSVDLTDPTTLAALGLGAFGLWWVFQNL